MCLPAIAIPIASLAISAVSTVASIGMGIAQQQQQAAQAQAQMQMQQEHQRQSMMQQMNQQRDNQILQQRQAQQSHNLQVEQSNVQMLNQYKQQQQAWRAEVGSIQNRHSADKLSYQRSREQYEKQIKNNAEGANRVYMQEQAKVTEVKKAAAFKMQENLAKAIGTEGTILASGRTGQSVGLLVNDVNRQMGFQQAQELAQKQKESNEQSISGPSSSLAEGEGEITDIPFNDTGI